MVVYFGADHKGFELKEKLKPYVASLGYEVKDWGDTVLDDEDDYVDFAARVASDVGKASETSRGILLCGSGVGMDVSANKITGVRAGLALSPDQVYDARHDDDINILVIAADFTDEETAKKETKVFLETQFAHAERFERRLQKITDLEK